MFRDNSLVVEALASPCGPAGEGAGAGGGTGAGGMTSRAPAGGGSYYYCPWSFMFSGGVRGSILMLFGLPESGNSSLSSMEHA